MRVTSLLLKVEKEASKQISRNQIIINRFASKYERAKQCFYTEDENDDLYNLFFDLSNAFGIGEEDIYFMYIESKWTSDGEVSKTFLEDFATHITLHETTKKAIE